MIQQPRRVLVFPLVCFAMITWLGVSAGAEPSTSRLNLFFREISRGLLGVNSRSHRNVKAAFGPVVRDARRSTVRVVCDASEAAFGTVVDENGFVISKRSELAGRIECILSDGRRVDAELVASDEDNDIALLKVAASGLVPIQWSTEPVPVGAWLATVGLDELPAAIGISSANARRIPAPWPALGVELETTAEGPLVTRVVPHSAAEASRLQMGDMIRSINGENMADAEAVRKKVRTMRTGDRAGMVVIREGRAFQTEAILGDRSLLDNKQAEIMEDLGGPLSHRRAGFPLVMEHDTVLHPRQCGGPLVDLSGKAVGINIARASRVASYAVPAAALQPSIARLVADAAGSNR
jgi:serine protease Do